MSVELNLWGNNADLIWHVCNLQWLEPFDSEKALQV